MGTIPRWCLALIPFARRLRDLRPRSGVGWRSFDRQSFIVSAELFRAIIALKFFQARPPAPHPLALLPPVWEASPSPPPAPSPPPRPRMWLLLVLLAADAGRSLLKPNMVLNQIYKCLGALWKTQACAGRPGRVPASSVSARERACARVKFERTCVLLSPLTKRVTSRRRRFNKQHAEGNPLRVHVLCTTAGKERGERLKLLPPPPLHLLPGGRFGPSVNLSQRSRDRQLSEHANAAARDFLSCVSLPARSS